MARGDDPRPVVKSRPPGGTGPADALDHAAHLGDDATRVGLIVGILVAVLSHGTVPVGALTSLVDMLAWVETSRYEMRDYLWATYDIDSAPKKPEPEKPDEPDEPEPEEPEPEIEEPDAPIDDAPEDEDPYEEEDAPPAPAEAGAVLTQEPSEDDPLIFDDGFVSGAGTGDTYGMVSAKGTAKKATHNRNAKVGGREGGTGKGDGKGKKKPGKKKPSKARPPGLVGGTSWKCPFPPEANTEQIDSAAAVIVVTVRPDGTPRSVKIVSDPGHGFGRAARMCALGRRYKPGLDRDGNPTTASSPPITVRFTR